MDQLSLFAVIEEPPPALTPAIVVLDEPEPAPFQDDPPPGCAAAQPDALESEPPGIVISEIPEEAWCLYALDALAKGSSQVTRVAALSPQQRGLVLDAILLYAAYRHAAYQAAKAGRIPPGLRKGWLNQNPDLAAAIAELHSHCLETTCIPAWPDFGIRPTSTTAHEQDDDA